MPAKKPVAKKPAAKKPATKKVDAAAAALRKARTKSKAVNGGINPATKRPHTDAFARTL